MIGLVGSFGSGKDEVARVLVAHRGYKRAAFGEQLKAEVRAALMGVNALIAPTYIFDLIREMKIEGDTDPGYKPTSENMRRLLQWWGTEYRRATDPDHWVKALAATHHPIIRPRLVITDVRFPNERKWVLSQGGEVWKVVRPCVAYDYEHLAQHESERMALEPDGNFDRVIMNDGDLDDLERKVLEIHSGQLAA
jgi:hypothetical protein